MIFPFLLLVDNLVDVTGRDCAISVPHKTDAAVADVVNGDVRWLLCDTSCAGLFRSFKGRCFTVCFDILENIFHVVRMISMAGGRGVVDINIIVKMTWLDPQRPRRAIYKL